MSSDKLKQCPFCSSNGIIVSFRNGNEFLVYRPECSKCSCQLGASLDEETAIMVWNTRV